MKFVHSKFFIVSLFLLCLAQAVCVTPAHAESAGKFKVTAGSFWIEGLRKNMTQVRIQSLNDGEISISKFSLNRGNCNWHSAEILAGPRRGAQISRPIKLNFGQTLAIDYYGCEIVEVSISTTNGTNVYTFD